MKTLWLFGTCPVCLNPQPQGFKVINKCVLSEMSMAMDEKKLICVLYLSHIIGQFI